MKVLDGLGYEEQQGAKLSISGLQVWCFNYRASAPIKLRAHGLI
jgi:hypothetical protein